MSQHLLLPLVLSIAAALATLALKSLAYVLTGSVGLLSDALESLINLVAAGFAYLSVRYAARPVDASHTYGHEKIEFFSSGLEGGLILAAAGGIAWYAVDRLRGPHELQTLGVGMALSLLASLLNLAVGVILIRAGRKHHSIVLEADGKHLLTDVWSSFAVVGGLGLVLLTGRTWLDPVLALAVAGLLLWTGIDLMRRSFDGLMDRALPDEELGQLRAVISANLGPKMDFHALRTRRAGARRFADFHLLVPGDQPVREAHGQGERVEAAIRAALPGIEVTIHIEPIDERRSYEDSALLSLEGKGPPGGA